MFIKTQTKNTIHALAARQRLKLTAASLLIMSASVTLQASAGHDHDAESKPLQVQNQQQAHGAGGVHVEGVGQEAETHIGHADEGSGHGEGGDEHEEAAGIAMSAAQQEMAGVTVERLQAAVNAVQVIEAPGELVMDQYSTTLVSAQVAARVVERSVMLGQDVEEGDPLVTLFSVEMAEIQGQYTLAAREWQRVKNLGKSTVGAKRYSEAQVSYQQSRAQVLAAGLTEVQLPTLHEDAAELGRFTIRAPHAGVVLADNFQPGQRLRAGDRLLTLVDESSLWVEAKLSPRLGQKIPAGTRARVTVAGQTFIAKVIQETHAIDEQTRTRNLRLQIDNRDHLLHPGLFAEVSLQLPAKSTAGAPLTLVPETALMRGGDGDWTVFIESKPGQFDPREVALKGRYNEQYQIVGVQVGERVAMTGAFFIASELAKGGFDPHNH